MTNSHPLVLLCGILREDNLNIQTVRFVEAYLKV